MKYGARVALAPRTRPRAYAAHAISGGYGERLRGRGAEKGREGDKVQGLRYLLRRGVCDTQEIMSGAINTT